MKSICFFIFIMISSSIFGKESKIENFEFPSLNASSIDQVIRPKRIEADIYTPYAVWYVKKGDFAPSCSLVDRVNKSKFLEIISPSDQQFGNCHQTLNDPLIISVKGFYYAIYYYVSEETRGDFSNEFQIVKLVENGFNPCKEDARILEYIKKNKDKNDKNLIAEAIGAVGCTPDSISP